MQVEGRHLDQVEFPTGIGAKRTTASRRRLGQTNGAIGYLGLAYVFSNKLRRR